MSAAETVFWLSVATAAYAYAGFPALVALVGTLRGRGVRKAPVTPSISVLIAAYNEEEAIAERLENALATDYPASRREVVVASDGSTDATERIVAEYAPRGVRLLRLPRRGKVAALDEAARGAPGEILVFSDANTHVEPGALRAMAACFADPEVGGVVGHTGYRLPEDGESSSRGEDLYWRYDTWIKEMESRTGSVVSAHGGLYAVRRELYRRPADGSVTDDFAISTAVVEQGKRLVFERDARAWEVAVPKAEREFRRRVRLMTRGMRGVALRRALLNPARHGFYSVVLLSHKVVRRLVPLALVALLASSLALAPRGGAWATVAAAQLGFYALAALGFAVRGRPVGSRRPLYVPFFFCMANAAALVALFRFVRGDRIERWQPQRHPAGA
jgi:cellulose synthase/poly-beta-1,6-N-acetylglucosamine synthase-like glycosyltransferase